VTRSHHARPPRPTEALTVDLFERLRRSLRPSPSTEPDEPPRPEPEGASQGATLEVVGERVVLTTPEGQRYALALEKLLEELGPRRRARHELVWPRGTRAVRASPRGFVIALELTPGIHRVRWIAPGSPAVRGKDAAYRELELALPYLVLVTGVHVDPLGVLGFTGWTEVYFSSVPLRSTADPLHYAPLLNVGRSEASGGAVVCLGGFVHAPEPGEDPSASLHRGLSAIVSRVLHAGFNEDFERIGRRSTFNDPHAKPDDARLATPEAWARASAEDPSFVLGIPWVPAGRTLEEAMEGVGIWLGILPRTPVQSETLQRLIVRHGSREARPAGEGGSPRRTEAHP
jgi:hypothetical protein